MGKNKPRDRKPKPMAGGIRIQGLCPALSGWRVLLLELDENDKPVMAKGDDIPRYSLVDIAFWALLVEEDEVHRYQEMLPVVPTTEGTMEPVDPEDPAFIAVITPAEKNSVIAKMVEDYVIDLPEMLEGDEEGGDGDE
jgi:hypothetical protein